MKVDNSKTGLTLIEIIITIAILSIVTLLLLSIFGNGFMHIINAGSDSSNLFTSQEGIETKIATAEPENSFPVTLDFPGYLFAPVKGYIITEDSLIGYNPREVEGFVDVDSFTVENSIVINGLDNFAILDYSILPDNATNKSIIWESDTPSVALVIGGVVQSVGAGMAEITATTVNKGLVETVDVTVTNVIADTSLYDIVFSDDDGATWDTVVTWESVFIPFVVEDASYNIYSSDNAPPMVKGLSNNDVEISYVQASNYSLPSGKSTAVIIVTSKDGNNTFTTYTFIFNKQ